jgi:hypothetical protein
MSSSSTSAFVTVAGEVVQMTVLPTSKFATVMTAATVIVVVIVIGVTVGAVVMISDARLETLPNAAVLPSRP